MKSKENRDPSPLTVTSRGEKRVKAKTDSKVQRKQGCAPSRKKGQPDRQIVAPQ